MEHTALNPFVPEATMFRCSDGIFEIHLHLLGVVTNLEITPFDRFLLVSGYLVPRYSSNSERNPSKLVWTDQPYGQFGRDIPINLSKGTQCVILETIQCCDKHVVRYTIRNSSLRNAPVDRYGNHTRDPGANSRERMCRSANHYSKDHSSCFPFACASHNAPSHAHPISTHPSHQHRPDFTEMPESQHGRYPSSHASDSFGSGRNFPSRVNHPIPENRTSIARNADFDYGPHINALNTNIGDGRIIVFSDETPAQGLGSTSTGGEAGGVPVPDSTTAERNHLQTSRRTVMSSHNIFQSTQTSQEKVVNALAADSPKDSRYNSHVPADGKRSSFADVAPASPKSSSIPPDIPSRHQPGGRTYGDIPNPSPRHEFSADRGAPETSRSITALATSSASQPDERQPMNVRDDKAHVQVHSHSIHTDLKERPHLQPSNYITNVLPSEDRPSPRMHRPDDMHVLPGRTTSRSSQFKDTDTSSNPLSARKLPKEQRVHDVSSNTPRPQIFPERDRHPNQATANTASITRNPVTPAEFGHENFQGVTTEEVVRVVDINENSSFLAETLNQREKLKNKAAKVAGSVSNSSVIVDRHDGAIKTVEAGANFAVDVSTAREASKFRGGLQLSEQKAHSPHDMAITTAPDAPRPIDTDNEQKSSAIQGNGNNRSDPSVSLFYGKCIHQQSSNSMEANDRPMAELYTGDAFGTNGGPDVSNEATTDINVVQSHPHLNAQAQLARAESSVEIREGSNAVVTWEDNNEQAASSVFVGHPGLQSSNNNTDALRKQEGYFLVPDGSGAPTFAANDNVQSLDYINVTETRDLAIPPGFVDEHTSEAPTKQETQNQPSTVSPTSALAVSNDTYPSTTLDVSVSTRDNVRRTFGSPIPRVLGDHSDLQHSIDTSNDRNVLNLPDIAPDRVIVGLDSGPQSSNDHNESMKNQVEDVGTESGDFGENGTRVSSRNMESPADENIRALEDMSVRDDATFSATKVDSPHGANALDAYSTHISTQSSHESSNSLVERETYHVAVESAGVLHELPAVNNSIQASSNIVEAIEESEYHSVVRSNVSPERHSYILEHTPASASQTLAMPTEYQSERVVEVSLERETINTLANTIELCSPTHDGRVQSSDDVHGATVRTISFSEEVQPWQTGNVASETVVRDLPTERNDLQYSESLVVTASRDAFESVTAPLNSANRLSGYCSDFEASNVAFVPNEVSQSSQEDAKPITSNVPITDQDATTNEQISEVPGRQEPPEPPPDDTNGHQGTNSNAQVRISEEAINQRIHEVLTRLKAAKGHDADIVGTTRNTAADDISFASLRSLHDMGMGTSDDPNNIILAEWFDRWIVAFLSRGETESVGCDGTALGIPLDLPTGHISISSPRMSKDKTVPISTEWLEQRMNTVLSEIEAGTRATPDSAFSQPEEAGKVKPSNSDYDKKIAGQRLQENDGASVSLFESSRDSPGQNVLSNEQDSGAVVDAPDPPQLPAHDVLATTHGGRFADHVLTSVAKEIFLSTEALTQQIDETFAHHEVGELLVGHPGSPQGIHTHYADNRVSSAGQKILDLTESLNSELAKISAELEAEDMSANGPGSHLSADREVLQSSHHFLAFARHNILVSIQPLEQSIGEMSAAQDSEASREPRTLEYRDALQSSHHILTSAARNILISTETLEEQMQHMTANPENAPQDGSPGIVMHCQENVT